MGYLLKLLFDWMLEKADDIENNSLSISAIILIIALWYILGWFIYSVTIYLLWNWVLPKLNLVLPEITFWQTFVLLVIYQVITSRSSDSSRTIRIGQFKNKIS